MGTRLSRLWDSTINSYWFLPSLLALTGLVLALVMVQVDRAIEGSPGDVMGPWYGGEPDSARTILSTIAGSIMTALSLAFSVTVVALALASSQLGPRLLHNFMRDRSNQMVLGTFIGTFIYCLLTLRMVGGGTGEWVPHASVIVGLGLALLSVAVLIFFIHHLVESIQADTVVATVAHELGHTIRRVFPESAQENSPELRARSEEAMRLIERPSARVCVDCEGILQAVDNERLVAFARKHDIVLRANYRPGNFVLRGSLGFYVWPPQAPSAELERCCSSSLLVGARRTLVQDAEFAFDQLVEVALRALSPSLNDAFTAMACIDRLGAGLALVAARAEQPATVCDAEGNLRLIIKTSSFQDLAQRAFDQIRQSARGDLAVQLRMLEVIEALLEQAHKPEQREALLLQVRMIRDDSLATAKADHDIRAVRDRIEAIPGVAAAEPGWARSQGERR